MALQVWLPLNGDLHNQGLQNITVTNNGATVNINGKIGKCYNFNNSMGIVVNNSITLGTTFSITCWIKINSYNQDWANAFKIYKDSYDYIGLCMNQANATTKQLGFHIYKNNGSNARTGVTDGYYMPLTVGKWYHLCFIVTPTQVTTYQDGIKIKTNNITVNFPSITNYNLSLGKSSLFGGLDCSINDFRLYDHALSDKEVEELSKGLVLHYKLNNGNPNLLSEYVTPGQGTPGVTSTGGRTNYYGKYGIIIPATENADTYFRLFLKQQLVQGTTYTISCYVSGLLPGSYYNFPLFAQGNTSMGVLQLNHNGLCSLTFTMNSSSQSAVTTPEGDTVYVCFMDDSARILASGQGTIIVNGFKLEQGNNATNFLSIDNDIICDSSGYSNNGTIVGLLEATTSDLRYNCTTSFDNKEYIIHKLPENMYQATYSFWVKASSYINYGAIYMPYQSPSAGTSPWFAINTESCKVWAYFGNNSPHYTKGSGTMSLNEWHHCVYVWNNGVAQWYVDGEKNGNSVTYTGRTFIQNTTNATIGNSYTGTSWNGTPFNGQISDFRIYATALTPAQIKELYKTSKIVNNTTITARDLE